MKKWYTSKTLIINLVMLVAYVLAWPELTQWVAPEHIAMAQTAVNLVLRLVTTTGVKV